jgi:hypothetical protein
MTSVTLCEEGPPFAPRTAIHDCDAIAAALLPAGVQLEYWGPRSLDRPGAHRLAIAGNENEGRHIAQDRPGEEL